MKTKTALAPEFRINKANRRKTKLFHVLVFLLLGFVLIGTASPFVARLSVKLTQVVETIRGNLAFEKKEAIEPLAPSFRNQIKEKVDPAVFEIKEFKEIDDYSLEAVDSRGVSAIFGNQTDLQNQVSSLQTLLVKSRIEAKKVKKIDLRFNKTVVEYQ
jgi:hypothetical protein